MKGEINFDHVWFAYNQDHWVLNDVDFISARVKPLPLWATQVGGKTTIISLLNRLYNIQKGTIKIDGYDINKLSPEYLRENIGVVLQDVFLFSGSVYENITLRNHAITREQVIEAAKMIDMHDFIMKLPGGYDFNVMERGATPLGQRQLLSFIRALLYNPSILVLDEATSSIDTESEQLIQKRLTL